MGVRLPHAVLCCTCLLLDSGGSTAHAAVTTCADADGRLTYTQFDCPGGTRSAAAPEGDGSLSIIRTTPLNDSERTVLDRLDRRLVASRERWERSRRQSAARQEAQRSAARERCEAARRALDDLAETRRQGYTAAEDRRYDAEEARWNAVRRADC